MARRAGVISISLSAGTAQFIADMDKANAKIRDFGRSAGQFGRPAITEARATSAAMKTLEGHFTNNTRAADKFLESVLGLGPVMQAAFPIIGGIAFAGMIGEIGKKVYEFFKQMQDAPEKIAGAFRGLNAPLRLTNDELALTNARLENDIAKLEGHHENTLKVALDEARVAADKLADSLDKDLASLERIMKEENIGFWKSLLGQAGTTDIKKQIGGETGFGGFRGRIAELTDQGNDKIRQATDLKAKDAAQLELNTKLQKAYAEELTKVNKQIDEAHKPKVAILPSILAAPTGLGAPQFEDQKARLELLKGYREQLQREATFVDLSATNTALTAKKTALEIANANAAMGRPFEDRMKALAAQIDAVKAKLEAIGKPEAAQIMAKAFGEAQKAITEVNKALEHHHIQLSAAQKAQILTAETTLVTAEAEAQWKTKLAAATTGIEDHIRSQNLLTAAIGKGYEAVRAANVETRIMQELGQHFTDAAWMQAHQTDVGKLRTAFGAEFDAKQNEQKAQTIEKLQEQIELEKALALVQTQGAEAVREATLALKLKKIAEDNDADSAKKLMAAEIELFNAQRANAASAEIAKLNERIAATDRLSKAILDGAEAERQAALENKYAGIERQYGRVAAAPIIARERQADEAEHQQKITQEALKTGMQYQNQIELIDQEITELEKIKTTRGDTMAIELSLRDLQNERLRALVDESLKLGSARDGVRAFFLEMQEDGKKAAATIYEAFNSVLDRTSANLAKLFTGQFKKTDWAKSFLQIGEQSLQATIKSQMQRGLGAIGKLFGIEDLGKGKADGSSGNPFWVKIAGGAIPGASPAGGGGVPRGTFGSGSAGGGPIFSSLPGTSAPGGAMPVELYDNTGLPLNNTGNPLDFGPSPGTQTPTADNTVFASFLSKMTPFSPSVPPAASGGAVLGGKPDGTATDPLWVRMAEALGLGAGMNMPSSTMAGGLSDAAAGETAFGPWSAWGMPSSGGEPNSAAPISRTALMGLPAIAAATRGGPGAMPAIFQLLGKLAGSVVPGRGGAQGGMLASLMKLFAMGGASDSAAGEAAFGPWSAWEGAASSGSDLSELAGFLPFGGFMATGGEVDPGHVYMVGEEGPEPFIPRSSGTILPSDALGAKGPNFTYHIDARGTDPVLTERRTRAGILAAHNSAVANAILASQEHMKRTPQRS